MLRLSIDNSASKLYNEIYRKSSYMKQLFTMDTQDYDPNWPRFYRPSVRGIIIDSDHKITLIYSKKYHFYKIPGGGIEGNESHLATLLREVKEETGLTVIPASIQEFGEVTRICKSGQFKDTIFVQQNYYYTCQTDGKIKKQHLDPEEENAELILQKTSLDEAINKNLSFISNNKLCTDDFVKDMINREYMVLKLLKESQSF